ncbi:PEP-CTERM sorting domain-containing protein [Haloferula sp.]|uniref:PEP-CTERM sorting domain-containing protein n=1 Tax=Haloferula sp. TaxID=2497595 RepID=UPI0032A04F6B
MKINHSVAKTTAVLLLAIATPSQAVIIGQDNFSDGDRTTADNSGANGGGPGLVWYATTNEDLSTTALTIVTDDGTPGIGGGNSLNMRPNSSSGNRPVVTTFSATTLGAAVGDKISASMDIRFISGVDGGSSNNTFRVGLFNSNTTPITGDGQRFDLESGTGNDFGYFARIPIGLSTNAGGTDARLSKETGVASGTSEDPLFGQDNSSGTGDDVVELGQTAAFPVTIADFESHTIVFSLERTASGVLTSIQVDGATPFTAEDTSSPFETFDELAMTNMRLTTEWRIDNVLIESIAIPEPSSLAMLGLAGGFLAFVRRRRTAA